MPLLLRQLELAGCIVTVDALSTGVAHDFVEEADKGDGRLEIRRHWITEHVAWITPRASGRACAALAWSSVSGTRPRA